VDKLDNVARLRGACFAPFVAGAGPRETSRMFAVTAAKRSDCSSLTCASGCRSPSASSKHDRVVELQ